MNLNELQIGKKAVVLETKGKDRDRQHLLDMGLIPGTEVVAVKRAPMGDPLEIMLHGYELAIRNSYAKNVVVEQINKTEGIQSDIFDYCKNCKTCKKDCAYFKQSELIDSIAHPGFGEPGKFHNKYNENPLPDNKQITFALVGNQNCGKTTLFNALTGSSQHVGNFPGVTIDRKDGQIKGFKNTKITDLPGIYSLSPYSSEEIISREFILNDDVDCIINIIDATNIQRSLYLTMQLLLLEHPMVVALNMMDEFAKNKGSVLINKLEYALGVPIVPISALKNEGTKELVDHALHIAKYQELPINQDFCSNDDMGGAVHRALHSIMHIIEDHCQTDKKNNHIHKIPIRFAAEKIAENDHLVFDALSLNSEDKEAIEHILRHMEDSCKLDRSALLADMRYSYIKKIVDSCVLKGKPSIYKKRSHAADKILTGRWTGIPSFILIMACIFWLTFNVIGASLQNLVALGISALAQVCDTFMTSFGINSVIHSFVMNGLFAGVGSILSFLPIIIVMFFFLSLLEDSGYVARVAFVMDKALRKIGLSGRSIVPMLIGFGCSVPAVMATRTLPSERDRKLTIMLIPYMSCSAKLPVYAFISGIFFPKYSSLIMLALYLGGILIGIFVALIAKGKSKPVPFIMELPNYRLPSLKNVLLLLWNKCKDFLQRAFTVILVATIIIWFLQSFDFSFNYVQDTSLSILSKVAGSISIVFAPIGLGDWRLVTSLISGFMMKESIVATMGVLFAGTQEIALAFSPLIASSFLIFCLLYTPCIAAITSVKNELGLKWAIFIVLFQCSVAWVLSFVVYNLLGIFV